MKNLDRIGTIQQPTVTNTNGSISMAWTNVVVFPFALVNASGSENKNADKIESVQTNVIEGRYYPGLTSKMRIVIDSENWNIQSIDEMGRRDRIKLTIRKNA